MASSASASITSSSIPASPPDITSTAPSAISASSVSTMASSSETAPCFSSSAIILTLRAASALRAASGSSLTAAAAAASSAAAFASSAARRALSAALSASALRVFMIFVMRPAILLRSIFERIVDTSLRAALLPSKSSPNFSPYSSSTLCERTLILSVTRAGAGRRYIILTGRGRGAEPLGVLGRGGAHAIVRRAEGRGGR